jgi:hypothetical protein
MGLSDESAEINQRLHLKAKGKRQIAKGKQSQLAVGTYFFF